MLTVLAPSALRKQPEADAALWLWAETAPHTIDDVRWVDGVVKITPMLDLSAAELLVSFAHAFPE